MTDISHLDALNIRLQHEREYLAAAKTEKERDIRRVWIAGIQREIANEMDFLGGKVDTLVESMSDDDLLAGLGL